jgi:predicted metal-dependent hydrolase
MKNTTHNRDITVLGEYEIELEQSKIDFVLKRSFKARLIWLRIDPEGKVSVTIPRGYNARLVPRYLQTRSKWILRNLERLLRQKTGTGSKSWNTGLPYQGRQLKVVTYRKESGGNSVEVEEDRLMLGLGPSAARPGKNILTAWLKEQAAGLIQAKTEEMGRLIGVNYKRITIRDQKSRWGSCSQKGNLNFNWRLIMAPPPVLEYVIVHELCHLREMNHSAAFWKWVAGYSPNWKEQRKWMDLHGRELRTCI